MASLMSRASFEQLARIRSKLTETGLPSGGPGRPGVAGIFVPWRGRLLVERGGIYWVGGGTEGDYGADREQTYESCYERAARLCDRGLHGRAHTPTWMFLDALTRALLDGPYEATKDGWGWSNLLKIGWSAGEPEDWPSQLIERQQAACAAALREEFEQLRNSLIFVGSLDDFGILGEALGGVPTWHGARDEATGIWWHRDGSSGNLFVHGCHPSAARRGQFSDIALERAVMLARNLLPRFN